MRSRRPTGICLNMIVRDETPVLPRLLASVLPVIDSWVIVDTGSVDGTPALIEQWMGRAGLPGQLHHRTWRNFGANRDEALQLAVAAGLAPRLLLIDADEELVCPDPRTMASLQPGTSYELEKHHGAIRYRLPNLIDVRANRWRWRGVVHEYLEHTAGPDRRRPLPGAWIAYHAGEGVRSRGRTAREKFLDDARMLEEALRQEPADARSWFYLGQSWRDAGEPARALQAYRRRAAMPGWDEETYCAQLEAGRMARALDLPFETVQQELMDAHELRPQRAEALHEFASYCRERRRWPEAFVVAELGAGLPRPADRLFVEPEVYSWRMLDELAVAAYWVGRPERSRDAAQEILRRHDAGLVRLSDDDRSRVQRNLGYALQRLGGDPQT